MKIILNRDDIEEAIQAYVKDKFMPYGDTRTINVTQGTKAMATVTLGDKGPQLPGLEDEEEDGFDRAIARAEERGDGFDGLPTTDVNETFSNDVQNNEGDLVDNSTPVPATPPFAV